MLLFLKSFFKKFQEIFQIFFNSLEQPSTNCFWNNVGIQLIYSFGKESLFKIGVKLCSFMSLFPFYG